jgi:hypothetical protein
MLGTRTLLGLAIDEQGVMVAEIGGRAGRPNVRRVGHWAFPSPFEAGQAQSLGQQLKQFLKTNHFASKQAVIGIPTKWIVAREIMAPPANTEALAGMLAIQAERAFSLNASELIFDYCGQPSASESRKIMLLAVRREMIARIKAMADAAGLQIQGVTVSALAFEATRTEANLRLSFGLYTRPTYCEFWSQAAGRPLAIKHVPLMSTNGSAGDRVGRLAAMIQRLMLLVPQQNQLPPYQITLYDTSRASQGLVDQLNGRLAPQITVTDGTAALRGAGLDTLDAGEGVDSVAAAVVAITGVGMSKPRVDFLNPRIGRKEKSSHKRVVGWTVFAAVVALTLVGLVVFDWHQTRADVAAYTEQLELMGDDVEAARAVVDRMSYARSWTSQKPAFLECLRQLTLAFPEAPTVWATSLAVNETGEGSLVGRAVDDASIIDVQDRIKQNDAFSDVQIIHIRDVGRNSSEKEFAVKFKFQGVR